MRKCDLCRYATPVLIGSRIRYACYYVVVKSACRPCPAGEECTVFEPLTDDEERCGKAYFDRARFYTR